MSFSALARRGAAVTACLSICLLGATLPATALAENLSLASGVYTRAQAKAGEDLYETHCGTCHEPEYFEGVFRAWNGVSLAELFDVLAATMPQSNPGSLQNAEYVKILSYILDENDFPRGDEPLNEYGRGFDAITVVAP